MPEARDTTNPSPSADAAPPRVRWSSRTRGGVFGNWFFIQLVRAGGLWLAYLWLLFVAAYFTCVSPTAFRASVDYFRRLRGDRPFWLWPVVVFRHFYSFGITLLDRLAVVLSPGKIRFEMDGESLLREHMENDRGIILLGAHVGSWEIGAHVLGRLGKPINLVVLEQEEAQVRSLFDRALKDQMFRILTTDQHPLRSIPIAAALRRGEVVAIHGDRSVGVADVPTEFLGGQARFPVGAYVLSAMTGAPIFQVFAVRERLGLYRFFTYPAETVDRMALRKNRDVLREYTQRYAVRLTEVVRRYPYQWFNLYPFWETPWTQASVPAKSIESKPA